MIALTKIALVKSYLRFPKSYVYTNKKTKEIKEEKTKGKKQEKRREERSKNVNGDITLSGQHNYCLALNLIDPRALN